MSVRDDVAKLERRLASFAFDGIRPGAIVGTNANASAFARFVDDHAVARTIATEARRAGVDPALVAAVAQAESGGNPNARSLAGAEGVMQLMPATAHALGVADPYDPVQNIRGGALYLRTLLDRFGDLRSAVAAYNAGPGAVAHFGGPPPYTETQAYVMRVMGAYRANRHR